MNRVGWGTRVGRKTVQTSLALGECVEYEEGELRRTLQSRGPKVGVRSTWTWEWRTGS